MRSITKNHYINSLFQLGFFWRGLRLDFHADCVLSGCIAAVSVFSYADARGTRTRNTRAAASELHGIKDSAMTCRSLFRLAWLFMAAGLAHIAAASATPPDIPDALKPWQGWVLHGQQTRLCPGLPGDSGKPSRLCAWPGALTLELGATGGQFAQDWRLYAEGWVPLPGGEHWPQAVTVDGQAVAVVEHDSLPSLFLGAGEHHIAGQFAWTRQPESLAVPTESALVRLSVDGKPVAWPERDGNAIWLGRRQDEKKEAESLATQVYRRLADGHPVTLETRLDLDVSGPGREVVLDPILPAGYLAMAIGGELPARLESDGRLRVQVRPGSWTVMVAARAAAPKAEITVPKGQTVSEEVWSFAADEHIRVASLEGATAIDPKESGVPDDWSHLPAYRVESGATLNLVERSRGMAAQDANRLHLNRQMWLAFDGGGFVMKDRISGVMHRDWRLDMSAPYVLRQASVGGEDLLVTEGGDGATGVELREPRLDLQTLGTVPVSDAQVATGWKQLFEGVDTVLNLPPGYRLVAASGADAAPEAWLSRWTLWDFFLVLIIGVAIGKLLGWLWGGLSLILLALVLHEPGSPQWLWLNLVAAVALVRYLPPNRFSRFVAWYRNASFVVLVLFCVPFVAAQLRLTLYPQLEAAFGGPAALGSANYQDAGYQADMAMPAPASAPTGAMESIEAAREQAARAERKLAEMKMKRAEAERAEAAGSSARPMDLVSRYSADARIQTGPGLPSWSWRQYRISWSGPVAPEQELKLWILPPAGLALCRLLAVGLLAILLAVFARQCFPSPRWPRFLSGGAPIAAALALVMLLPALPAHADTAPVKPEVPPASILNELKRRLLEPPPCFPRCAELPASRVMLAGDTLTIELDIHALATSPVAIPGAIDGWLPTHAELAGKQVPILHDGEVLRVVAEPGLSRLVLTGAMPPSDSVAISFPDTPHTVSARVEGWDVAGLVDGRLQGGHLEFTRVKASGESPRDWAEMTRIPVFVDVRRTVLFDRDWSVSTTVSRRAPERGPISLAIPLLPGESVRTAGVQVQDGKVLVSIPAGEDAVSWDSFLERKAELVLTAAETGDYVEQWRYGASPSLHVEHAGVPSLAPAGGNSDYSPEFYPLPGESLRLTIGRPKPSAGDTLAIDRVDITSTLGQRAAELHLDLAYRSSRGSQYTLTLPADAVVNEVLADGRRLGLRPDGGKLLLPIQPGSHQLRVSWRQDGDIALKQTLPAVDLQHPASNLSVSLELPADRWVLLVGGPRLGPAVLYWGELAVFILVAFALGRTRLTPLKTRHWLLLGLGLSTLAWPTLALVAAWLFVVAWRGRGAPAVSSGSFNAIQVGVGALTAVALLALVAAIPQALLSSPDMHILGNNSYGNSLHWFSDQTEGPLPSVYAVSLPLWVYKLAMLAWSLWLSFAVMRWLRWGWTCFTAGGLWRESPHKTRPVAPAPAAPAEPPPSSGE